MSLKKIVIFVGSARKKHTYDAAVQFLSHLQALGEVEGEIVRLSDYELRTCIGCKVCFDRGEQHCPLNDDRDALIAKLMSADGVVMASPNYAFQVSALTKTFIDRLGFAFHRPRMFDKTYTSIVAQGIFGGGKIVKYLDFVGYALGMRTVKGTCVMTLDPMTDKQRAKMDAAMAAQARRFNAMLRKPVHPNPTLVQLMFFRMSRTKVRVELDDRAADWRYYAQQGWLEDDYYYPVSIGPVKRLAGRLFDGMFTRMAMAR